MKLLALVICLFIITDYTTAVPAPGLKNDRNSRLDQVVNIVQQLQNMGQGIPQITNITQKILDELAQFRQSRLFFGNPCTMFQSIFRSFYCTVASFDPQRNNPIIQGALQFLNANQMFYNFASNFFCPFQAFGGGNSGSSSGNSAGINCASNSGSQNTGFTSLDDPAEFNRVN